jgi:hypothetical protein
MIFHYWNRSCGRFAFSKVEKCMDHTHHPSVLTFLNFLLQKCQKIESFMLHTSLYINCIIFHHITLVFENNIIVVFYPQIHLHCKYLLDFGLIITCYQADILPWDQTRNIFYPIWRYIILLLSSWNSIMNSCITDTLDRRCVWCRACLNTRHDADMCEYTQIIIGSLVPLSVHYNIFCVNWLNWVGVII